MKKRLLAMLMVLSMALSILPMSAMAAPGDGGGDQEAANQKKKQPKIRKLSILKE